MAVMELAPTGARERTCKGCGNTFPLTTEYFHRAGVRYGMPAFRHQCRACQSEIVKKRGYVYSPEAAERRREQRQERYAREDVQERRRKRAAARRTGREKEFPALPARPVVAAVQDLITRESRFLRLQDPLGRENIGAVKDVCARLNLQERTLRAWATGERPTVQFDLVDRTLLRGGWLWWEVFNEDTVRVPVLVVQVREERSVRARDGGRRDRMETVRREYYGDLGVDREALRMVEHTFTGEGSYFPPAPYRPPRSVAEYRAARAQRREAAA